jgi:2,4-diaminopentanoate dehydrogenase
MALKVVHCGTGIIGRAALDGILNHPDLDLVGMYVNSPEKVGRDAASFIERDAVGVVTTNDWNELLALKPDCLAYFADSIGRELDAAADIHRFLEAGSNAVTASVFAWAYPPDVPPEFSAVHDACAKGGTSAFFSGVDPGWATTDLAIASLAIVDEVECITVTELGYWGDYEAEFVCREYFGFGQLPGFEPLLIKGGFLHQMWAPTLKQLAHVMGVEIEDWNIVYETDCLDHDIETGFGTVKAGTAAVVHFELQAINDGRPFAVVEHVDRVGFDAGLQWKAPYGPERISYRIEITGKPDFTIEYNFGGKGAPPLKSPPIPYGAKSTAMPCINAIPAVCAARPGLLWPLDLPHVTTRNVRRKK